MVSVLRTTAAEQNDSASRRAYAFVKERLLDGTYASGMLLSETELARTLGISRTPVRQALVHLEAEEMLDLHARRGALVRPVSRSEAQDVLEARMLIETHCARRVAVDGRSLSGAMRDSLAAQKRSLVSGGDGFVVADREFHRVIVAAEGNEVLTRQYDALRDRQQQMLGITIARDRVRIGQLIAEHRRIADAIVHGDGATAADLTAAHLRSAYIRGRIGGRRPNL